MAVSVRQAAGILSGGGSGGAGEGKGMNAGRCDICPALSGVRKADRNSPQVWSSNPGENQESSLPQGQR